MITLDEALVRKMIRVMSKTELPLQYKRTDNFLCIGNTGVMFAWPRSKQTDHLDLSRLNINVGKYSELDDHWVARIIRESTSPEPFGCDELEPTKRSLRNNYTTFRGMGYASNFNTDYVNLMYTVVERPETMMVGCCLADQRTEFSILCIKENSVFVGAIAPTI